MKNVYINSSGSISPQKTFDNSIFLEELTTYDDNVINVINPNYKDFIPPAAARRMAKGIKMGVTAAKIALKEVNLENVDAIITGTGMGCVRDSEKFVSTLIDHEEQFLTPTSFIQSTHNTVGGQIALGIKCKGYNFTYVHSSNSFESCLLDAKLMLQAEEATNILIGGIDELGDHTTALHKLINHVKSNKTNTLDIVNSKTKGAVFGEGANFFVLSNEKKENTYCKVINTKLFNTLPLNELERALEIFLADNKLTINDIDISVLGNNGDVEYDGFYHLLSEGSLKETQQVYYKHLCGEYNTASAFGIWMASKIIKTQKLPDFTRLNKTHKTAYKTVLIYNQYRGQNHSFTILQKC